MIHKILPVITAALTDFFPKESLATDTFMPEERAVKVELSELMKLDGSVEVEEFRVICTLINVEHDRSSMNFSTSKLVKTNPPVALNLYILFSAYFPSKHYLIALKYLSYIIAFFQGKAVFTPQNTPGLPGGISKVTAEIVNLDMRELSNFWNAVGAKHLPSVIYKLRMVTISDQMILEETPAITGIDTKAGNLE